jgi:nucleoid DNA-binding protein
VFHSTVLAFAVMATTMTTVTTVVTHETMTAMTTTTMVIPTTPTTGPTTPDPDDDDAEVWRNIIAEDRARDDALDAALAKMPTSVSMADACRHVAETVGLKTNQVNEVVEATVALAATQLKLVGSFNIAGAVALRLKKTHERTTMKGAKAAGKGAKAARIVRARPLKKFKDMVSLFE